METIKKTLLQSHEMLKKELAIGEDDVKTIKINGVFYFITNTTYQATCHQDGEEYVGIGVSQYDTLNRIEIIGDINSSMKLVEPMNDVDNLVKMFKKQ